MKRVLNQQRSFAAVGLNWITASAALAMLGLFLIAFANESRGQTLDSKRTIIVGHVTDELGAMLDTVEILVKKDRKVVAKSVSTEAGRYELLLLPGVYTFEFRKSPYRPFEIQRYVVPIGVKNWRLDVCLECPNCERLDLPGV